MCYVRYVIYEVLCIIHFLLIVLTKNIISNKINNTTDEIILIPLKGHKKCIFKFSNFLNIYVEHIIYNRYSVYIIGNI